MRPPVTRWAYNNVFVRIAVVAVALLTGVAVLGVVPKTAAVAEISPPAARIHVGPPNSIVGQGAWIDGATVNVTIDDPDDVYDRDGLTAIAGSDTIYGDSWRIEDDSLGLQAGFVVTATDGATTRTHVVKPITFTSADLESGTVTGSTTLVGDDWVEVALFSDVCRRRNVDVNGGVFVADFSVSGGELDDEAATCVLNEGSFGSVEQYDDDGDLTFIMWRVPNPSFSVEVPNQVWSNGEDWPLGIPVEVVVDDDDVFDLSDSGSFLCHASTLTQSWGENPWEQGFNVNFGDPGYPSCEIQPGNVVTVLSDADGAEIYKDLVVVDLSITGVDADGGIITGYAPPEAWVNVNGGNEFENVNREVQAASGTDVDPGYWTADLATDLLDGSGALSVPFASNTGGGAQVFDDDGDSTHRGWCHDCDGGSQGNEVTGIHIDPIANMIEGGQWPGDTALTFTFDDPATEELDCAAMVFPTDGEGVYRFYLDEPDVVAQCDIDPKPGWAVTVTDGSTFRGTEIVSLQITGIDWTDFVVNGTGVPGEVVRVQAFVQNGDPWRTVTVDEFGGWTVDFGVPGSGDDPREEEIVNELIPWFQVRAHRYDFDNSEQQDNDATVHDAQMPRIDVGFEGPPNWNPVIESHGWPFGALVDIVVADESGQEVWSDTTSVDNLADYGGDHIEERPRDEGGFFHYFEFPDGFQFEPGWTVAVAAPEHPYATKSMTVAQLTIDSLDSEENRVYGTAAPNTELFVFSSCWFEPAPQEPDTWGGAINRLIQADEFGSWSADFSEPGPGLFADFEVREQPTCDLALDADVGALQFDEDFDTTQRQFHVPNPPGEPHFGVSATIDFVEGFDFSGDMVTVTFYDTVGAMLFETIAPVNHDDGGRFDLPLGPDFDVEVGQLVMVSDGTDTKSTYVAPVNFTDVDLDGDTVSGIADPGADVNLEGSEELNRTVTADDDGSWFVDLSGEFDLQVPLLLTADQTDEDNDRTFAVWETPALVEGHVQLDGVPLVDVEVFLSPGSHTCTDADGAFAFADVSMIDAALYGTFVATGPAAKDDSAGCSNASFVDDDGVPLMVAAQGGFDLWDGFEYIEFNVERTGALQTVVAQDWDGVAWSPIDGLVIRAFNPEDPGFVAEFGSNPAPSVYRNIFDDSLGEIGMAFTGGLLSDVPGTAEMRYPGVSDVLVLVEYPDSTVYGARSASAEFADRGDGVYVGPTLYFPEPNTTPTITTFQGPIDPYALGFEGFVAGTFLDPDVGDTFTIEVDWGDGTTTTPTYSFADGEGSVNDSHFYLVPGIHTITLTVRDARGGEDVAEYDSAVVFDPDGKSISGSPQVKIGDVSDKINFNIKYDKKTGDPEGHLKYTHKVDPGLENLKFNAEEFHFMWIFGDWAMTSGSGTFESTGEAFEFRLTVFDGKNTNTDDTFRFVLWTEDTDEVFYDSQPGDPAFAFPTTVPTQGSVKVKVK